MVYIHGCVAVGYTAFVLGLIMGAVVARECLIWMSYRHQKHEFSSADPAKDESIRQ
jgi:hypothetical protein